LIYFYTERSFSEVEVCHLTIPFRFFSGWYGFNTFKMCYGLSTDKFTQLANQTIKIEALIGLKVKFVAGVKRYNV
jgi:hypothetical protein